MSDIHDIFRKRLREIRKLRKMTHADVAKDMRIPESSISHFENGTRFPSFKNLCKLSDALFINIDYLAGKTDERAIAGAKWKSLSMTLESLSARDLEVIANFAEVLKDHNMQKIACHRR